MKQRFDELLPWYANGTLGEEDRAWVDRYLEDHPESDTALVNDAELAIFEFLTEHTVVQSEREGNRRPRSLRRLEAPSERSRPPTGRGRVAVTISAGMR